mmetsp:Transcript_43407/g.102230  ORF Transcript_43407/g.102230 Transcript_43407/m.102230 type:complete len:221 (-) Transcript_43407:61-723(-)
MGCASGKRNSLDLNHLGQQVLEVAHRSVGYGDLNCLWSHPTSSAKLYVGSKVAACDKDTLRSTKITCVVVCLETLSDNMPFRGSGNIEYFHFPTGLWRRGLTRDASAEALADVMAPLLGYVEDRLQEGRSILIHCLAGAHRAGTAGIACLMRLADLGAIDAVAKAQACRKVIDPIFDFQELLRILDDAQKRKLLTPAIERARAEGYEKAAAKVFGKGYAR